MTCRLLHETRAAARSTLQLLPSTCTRAFSVSTHFPLCYDATGELYPTEVRTTAHGFSAGVAKLGALWATIFFNYIGNKPRFWRVVVLDRDGAGCSVFRRAHCHGF